MGANSAKRARLKIHRRDAEDAEEDAENFDNNFFAIR
jgi:hypothetical protein